MAVEVEYRGVLTREDRRDDGEWVVRWAWLLDRGKVNSKMVD